MQEVFPLVRSLNAEHTNSFLSEYYPFLYYTPLHIVKCLYCQVSILQSSYIAKQLYRQVSILQSIYIVK